VYGTDRDVFLSIRHVRYLYDRQFNNNANNNEKVIFVTVPRRSGIAIAVPAAESCFPVVDSLIVVANEAEFFVGAATTATTFATTDCSFSSGFKWRRLALGLEFKRRPPRQGQVITWFA